MLTEDQKKQIKSHIQMFKEKALEYIHKQSNLDECEKNTQVKMEELSKVAEKERQMETAMEVLYGQAKKQSRTRKIEEEITDWQQKSEILRNELTQLKTELLEKMRNLPFPADLENPKQKNSETTFPFFGDTELGEEVIDTICDLLRQKPPLNFNDVTILPNKAVVKNTLRKQEAIQKLVGAIQSFRMRVDTMSKSYEKIDEVVERLIKSELYSGVLKTLAEKGGLSTGEIASILNVDKRTVYDACYNLTRSNWSPAPIQKTPSGEWKLTLAGEILINRVFEKYPDKKTGTNNVEESR